MKLFVKFACLMAAPCAMAVAQNQSSQTGATTTSTSSPVAYVYVSNSPTSSSNKINAYSAAANGALTPVSGSPFSADVRAMALNSKYLFGANFTYVYSYAIASNGALKYISSFNATQKNPGSSGGPGTLFLDHTGASLYDGDIYAYGTESNAYQYFDITTTPDISTIWA
jgi:hypothetical protein